MTLINDSEGHYFGSVIHLCIYCLRSLEDFFNNGGECKKIMEPADDTLSLGE